MRLSNEPLTPLQAAILSSPTTTPPDADATARAFEGVRRELAHVLACEARLAALMHGVVVAQPAGTSSTNDVRGGGA